ncbi:MAG: hypothetical protein LBQ05_03395, partial [Christensenellaceae bacterium]|nr:hypothetical protein [Christensenellaceae bacterium]
VSVVCDKYENGFYICRTTGQSPEVDPCVLIKTNCEMTVGTEYKIKITGTKKHNLTGGIVWGKR